MLSDILNYMSGNIPLQVSLTVILLAFVFYSYMISNYQYWKIRGVPFIEPKFFYGSVKDIITSKENLGVAFQKFYNDYENHRYVGGFENTNPFLILRDIELIKFVMKSGFENFTDRWSRSKQKHDYLKNHLFNMEGEEWKAMRRNLTPIFTSGKMKNMFSMIEKCIKQLEEEVERLAELNTCMDCKDLMGRFTSDVIASCTYGLEVNCIVNRDNEFYRMTQRLFSFPKFDKWKRALLSLFPKLFSLLHIHMTDKLVRTYLPELVQTTIAYREEHKIYRNDFLDLLLNIKLEDREESVHSTVIGGVKKTDAVADEKRGLSMEEICSQTVIFFAAGFETAASSLSFCMYELARHPEIQNRLRTEVVHVLKDNGDKLSYEAIQQMKYMDLVINETLRRYASLPVITRRCVRSTKLPGTDLIVEKGVPLVIPTYALHHDPHYYPDPYQFDPERFTKENMAERHPFSFLPFGEGPRMCIGMRFGRMQIKTCLASLLPKFHFSLPPDMPQPLPISPRGQITSPACPIKITVTKVKN